MQENSQKASPTFTWLTTFKETYVYVFSVCCCSKVRRAICGSNVGTSRHLRPLDRIGSDRKLSPTVGNCDDLSFQISELELRCESYKSLKRRFFFGPFRQVLFSENVCISCLLVKMSHLNRKRSCTSLKTLYFGQPCLLIKFWHHLT